MLFQFIGPIFYDNHQQRSEVYRARKSIKELGPEEPSKTMTGQSEQPEIEAKKLMINQQGSSDMIVPRRYPGSLINQKIEKTSKKDYQNKLMNIDLGENK